MDKVYYDAYRKQMVDSFNSGVKTIVNNPQVKQFGDAMLGTFVAKDIATSAELWKKKFNEFDIGFKKNGKKFMSQQEWNQFVDSVALETRNKYLKF